MMDIWTAGKPDFVPCEECGTPVAQKPGPGRIKKFCTPWHGEKHRAKLMLFDLDGNILN